MLLIPLQSAAQEISLKSTDGTINLTGQLIKFENGNYVVSNEMGELSIAAGGVSCEGAACPKLDAISSSVNVIGSDTIGKGLMPLLMSGYATFLDAEATIQSTATKDEILASFVAERGFGDPIGSFTVTPTASHDAFTGLNEKRGDIGMASRRITPDEARALKDSGAGNMINPKQEHIIALDSLVVIVNKDNPLQSVNIGDLAKIFSGQVTNWSELGGPDLPIQVVTRKDGSGTLAVFQSRVFTGDAPAGPADQVEAADNGEAATFVNANPGAITFVAQAFQRGAKALPLINECGITSTPDAFSVKTEEYSIQRRLYLYNRGDVANPLITNFLDFTMSPVADQMIAQAGFVDLGVISTTQGPESARAVSLAVLPADPFEASVAQELTAAMAGTERLSSTFRFRAGSTKLDDRALLDMARLIEYLKTMPAGTKVSVVGFSDNAGEFEPNRDLSKGRADLVVKELLGAAGDQLSNISISTLGFGEIAPVACNDSETGREANRRVEVWLTRG